MKSSGETSMIVHRTTVELSQSVPDEVGAGTDVCLNIRVACAAGCDLRTAPVAVLAGDDAVAGGVLSSYDGAGNETGHVTFKAPSTVGEHAWTVVFRYHETESVAHEESSLPVNFKTVPHATSMAIWDAPSSPVTVDHPFTVEVGVKCSLGCALGGQIVVVADESGRRMGHGRLNETPWPETAGLYVAEVALSAPPSAGLSSWTAGFAETSFPLPHAAACAAFTFLAGPPLDHEVSIRVTDAHAQAPIEQVQIRCGCYRASTNAQGLATFQLPAGTYEVSAWKPGYDDTTPTKVQVHADLLLHLETTPTVKTNPDEERVWM